MLPALERLLPIEPMTPADLEQTDSSTRSSSEGVAAVDRAFAILGAFDADHPVLTLAELARRTGLYKSTILRLISSIEKAGFIRRLADGQFTIGHEPSRLANLYQTSFRLRDILYPLLQELSDETGETSSFYVEEGESRVVLFRVEPKRTIKVSIHEGDRFPLTVGASGKVLRVFGREAASDLPEVAEQYWASSSGERDPEIAAVSVPVFGPGQLLQGALTLSGPVDRFRGTSVERGCQLLLRAAVLATAALGGNCEGLGRAARDK